MSEEQAVPATPAYPALTTDDKLAIREAQFILTNTREQALAAVQAAEKNLLSMIEHLAKKYNMDANTTNFNLNMLTFSAK